MYNSESYFDYALELASENHEIEEAIVTPKLASFVKEATEEQLSSIKKQSFTTVTDFIQNILDKTYKQIDVIESKFCTPDEELISLCEQKIKDMTSEECNAIILKGTNEQDCINKAIEIVTKDCYLVDADMVDFCKGNFHDDYTNMRKHIKSCNEQLESVTNFNKVHTTDITFRDICNIIYEYRNFNIQNECKIVSKESVDESKITITLANVKDIKDIIYESTDYLVKAKDSLVELQLASFKNKEDILNQFISL
jgi:hypothetical protein